MASYDTYQIYRLRKGGRFLKLLILLRIITLLDNLMGRFKVQWFILLYQMSRYL